MSIKARKIEGDGGWAVFCPACQCGHRFDSRWTFNGDVEKPTFHPSMLISGKKYPSGNKWPTDEEHQRMMNGEDLSSQMLPDICHSFVRDGRIEYLGDCTHHLAGKTVDLEEF